jgi:DNA-directed RNA polymerase specialized sigma24 family protein
MDQLYVEAPPGAAATAPIERAFSADFPLVLNYVARLTDNVECAGGIAGEAYRMVIRKAGGMAGWPGFRAEVFRVATELSRDVVQPRRLFKRRRTFPLQLTGFPPADARRAIRRDTVQRALAALPFEARSVVLLRDFARLSYDELAHVLNTSPKKLIHVLDRSRAEFGEIYDYIKF